MLPPCHGVSLSVLGRVGVISLLPGPTHSLCEGPGHQGQEDRAHAMRRGIAKPLMTWALIGTAGHGEAVHKDSRVSPHQGALSYPLSGPSWQDCKLLAGRAEAECVSLCPQGTGHTMGAQ